MVVVRADYKYIVRGFFSFYFSTTTLHVPASLLILQLPMQPPRIPDQNLSIVIQGLIYGDIVDFADLSLTEGYLGSVPGPMAVSAFFCLPKPRVFSKPKATVRYSVSVFIFKLPFTGEAIPPQPLASNSPFPNLYPERSQILGTMT